MLLGQVLLLAAFVGAVYGAAAVTLGWWCDHRGLVRSGLASAAGGVAALTVVLGLLAYALVVKDFRIAYVAEYSSRVLPWHYSLSALWVGQAGSLLLWAWLLGVLALGYRLWPRREPSPLREPAFGILMGYLGFLAATMVFAADPLEPSLSPLPDGQGLSPLLQHPAMLVHPPIVFLGYAGWAIPFALAAAALATGRLDAEWVRQARPWALFSWAVLGCGILLGAEWAYEELGWGGYWAWDPVENGSLIPWLTGTALIHAMIAWQYRAVWKKTALLLAVATFGLCNFATFLTRSGVFSSLHAFSESTIGWMFLGLMIALSAFGAAMVVLRRKSLRGEHPIAGMCTREALTLMANLCLLLLAAAALGGTLSVPISTVLVGDQILVGPAFYNYVLIPTGLVLLLTVAVAPLVRWGRNPTPQETKALCLCLAIGGAAAVAAIGFGLRHPIALVVTGLAATAAAGLIAALALDCSQRAPGRPWLGLWPALCARRRQYAGFLLHAAFVCLALGVTGSSLGSLRHEAVMSPGETLRWAGYTVRYMRRIERPVPDGLVVEAELHVAAQGGVAAPVLPAQHYYALQNQWTSEVGIRSTWTADFYAILHQGEGQDRVRLTLLHNPMMRWLWLAGWIAAAATPLALWPAGRRSERPQPIAAPHFLGPASRRAASPRTKRSR